MAGNNGKRNIAEMELPEKDTDLDNVVNNDVLPEGTIARFMKANQTLTMMKDSNNTVVIKANVNNSPKYIGEMQCPVKPEDILRRFTVPRENRYFIITIITPDRKEFTGSLDMRFTPEPARQEPAEQKMQTVHVDTGDKRIDQIFGMLNQSVERQINDIKSLYEKRIEDLISRQKPEKDPFDDFEKFAKMANLFKSMQTPPAAENPSSFAAMEKMGESYLKMVKKLASESISSEALEASESKIGTVINLLKDLAPAILPMLNQLFSQPQQAQSMQQPQQLPMITTVGQNINIEQQLQLIHNQNKELQAEINCLKEQFNDMYEEEEPDSGMGEREQYIATDEWLKNETGRKSELNKQDFNLSSLPQEEIQEAIKLFGKLNPSLDFTAAIEEFSIKCPAIWTMIINNPDVIMKEFENFNPELAQRLKPLLDMIVKDSGL